MPYITPIPSLKEVNQLHDTIDQIITLWERVPDEGEISDVEASLNKLHNTLEHVADLFKKIPSVEDLEAVEEVLERISKLKQD